MQREMDMNASSARRQIARCFSGLAATAAAAFLAACGGSGASGLAAPAGACVETDPAAADQCATLLTAVTDADGDFISYTVDVLSIALQRAGGGIVETLPAAARVDFAELADLAELLSVATLAPGDIVGGTIRLDYGSAEIYVESGGAVVPAVAVDAGGAPLGVVEIEIRLAARDRLSLTRGRAAFLSIDFDLAASHDVDLSTTPARVLARPYLAAEVRPLVEKEMRVRGALVAVDLGAGQYDIRVRPWHRPDGDFGLMTVTTTAATTYEIDGEAHTGGTGLAALGALGAGTPTVAFGTLDLPARTFTAEIVHAGDSAGDGRFAAVQGNVVARSGDRLTIKGALTVHPDRPARFRRTVLVDVGSDTAVTKVGDPHAALDEDDVSVGQRIVAFGEFTNVETADGDPATVDAALVLDATHGRVRMLVTHLHGTVKSVSPGQVDMELRAIDRLGIGFFDFSGTGMTAALDADPLDYEIATGTLALAALETGKWARVHGFAAAFGEAPPDFIGRTLIGHRDIPAALGIAWGAQGTSAPFTSMGPETLVLDLANPAIGARHHLLLGRRRVDLLDLPVPPSIVPADERGSYGLWESGRIELFADFAAFVEELSLRLGGGGAALSLAAYGAYDESAHAVVANRVVMHVRPVSPE